MLRTQESGTELAPDGRLLRFGSVEEFVTDFVLPVWGHDRSNREIRWCLQWWEHPGAQVRLEVLWAAFEHMRLEPAPAMDVWFRDHLVPAMDWLTREAGPFHGCSQTLHKDPQAWSAEPAPGDYFETFPSENEQLRSAAAEGA
ncbi:hypothetical protein VV01_00260 [Luteipulveratus halotolerans]|uniref:DUF4913 domain-containing protein n=2 Tax=Luteipulveratus halotolerans TaxID=1631356 RepID=A0A0L6CPQ4_9MICO|nr:hypothetical protein VV01_00260 [Luteipulveratus halotolerans]